MLIKKNTLWKNNQNVIKDLPVICIFFIIIVVSKHVGGITFRTAPRSRKDIHVGVRCIPAQSIAHCT